MARIDAEGFENSMRKQFEDLLYEDSSSDDAEDVEEQLDDLPTNDTKNSSYTESSEEDPEIVILSLIWQNEHLGASYYNVSTSELFIMDDVIDDKNFTTAKTIYRQSNPHSLITISGLSENFIEALKLLTIVNSLESDDDEEKVSGSENSSCTLKIMAKSEYSFDYCFSRAQSLKLEGEPLDASHEERNTHLSSFLNFNSRAMIHALGLLLKYLDKEWYRISLGRSEQPLFINISYISLADLVMMDQDSYKALNIVNKRDHPSSFKFGSDSIKKHTISLYSLFNNCQSRLGSQALWKMMHHPTTNIPLLEKRHQVIEFFLNPGNEAVVDSLKNCLKRIYRLSPYIVNKISVQQAKYADWRKLEQTISNVIQTAEICGQFRKETKIFAELADSVTQKMHLMKYFIDLLVDFEMTQLRNKFVLNSGVDSVFDELNHISNNLPRILSEIGEKDLPNISAEIESYVLVYIPNIEYLLAVTRWRDGSPPNDPEILGLEYKFTIEGVHHYKCQVTKELDEKFGDVKVKLARRQNTLMMKLVKYVVHYLKEITNAMKLCTELDVLLSFYMVARDSNYVKPEIVNSRIIAIKRGRHPLREAFVTSFVPNDTFSGEGSSLVKIFTGPNACGKSIYLKQIALIIFMGHIGSYVPADSATIGIISRIHTQIVFNNSISLLNASTFLQDIRQANSALHSATPDSLVILDEFGRGTSETDGLALLVSVLIYFLERGDQCPHIFAATHLHRVIDLIPKGPLVQMQTFEFLQPNDQRDIVFLYRLIDGVSKLSFAHAVAKNAGLNSNILKRAMEVYESRKQGLTPPRLKNTLRQNTSELISQRLLNPNTSSINLEDLRTWIFNVMGINEEQLKKNQSAAPTLPEDKEEEK